MPGYRPSSCIGWLWIDTASKSVNTQKKGTRTICRHDNLLHESPILPIQLDNHRAGFGLLFSLTELAMYLKNVSDRRVIPTQLDQLSVSLSDWRFVCLWAFLYLSAVSFQELGCFKDKAKDRAMGNMLKSFRKFIDWRDMSKTVKNCSDVARSRKWVDLEKVMLVKDDVY